MYSMLYFLTDINFGLSPLGFVYINGFVTVTIYLPGAINPIVAIAILDPYRQAFLAMLKNVSGFGTKRIIRLCNANASNDQLELSSARFTKVCYSNETSTAESRCDLVGLKHHQFFTDDSKGLVQANEEESEEHLEGAKHLDLLELNND